MDVRGWFFEFVTSPAFWALCLGGSVYLFKDAMGRALDKRVESHKIAGQQQTEQLKSALQGEVQRDVERLKAELMLQGQHQLEQLRAELSARNEAIRHEMQKQFLRAQLATTKTHEVYAQLLKRIRRAEGAVGNLWGARWETDLSTYSIEELAKTLKDARPGGEVEDDILSLLESSRQKGIDRIKEVLRQRELVMARGKLLRARNYIILESIFVTQRVRDLADDVLKELWAAWTSDHASENAGSWANLAGQHDTALKAAAKKIGELEEAMRADLLPELIAPVPTAAPGAGTK